MLQNPHEFYQGVEFTVGAVAALFAARAQPQTQFAGLLRLGGLLTLWPAVVCLCRSFDAPHQTSLRSLIVYGIGMVFALSLTLRHWRSTRKNS